MTAMSEKQLEEMKKKLQESIDQQLKDLEFKESAIDALEDASNIIVLESRAEKLTAAIGILELEEITISDEIADRAEDFEDEAHIIKSRLDKKVTLMFEEMNYGQMMRFVTETLKHNGAPQFKYIVSNLTPDQKEDVYDLLHSEKPKDYGDETLIWQFEKLVGYDFEFAKNNIIKSDDPLLEPFMDFLGKYVKVYNDKIPARLEWMKTLHDLKPDINEKTFMRYVDGAIRGLGIARSQDEPIYKEAAKDFAQVFAKLIGKEIKIIEEKQEVEQD